MRTNCYAFYVLFATGTLLGCSSDCERLPVSGTVSLDGKPVEECVLVFVRGSDGGSSSGAIAQVSKGKFSLSAEAGLQAGVYGILVSERQPDLEEYEQRRASGAKNGLAKSFLPNKYKVPNELRFEITSYATQLNVELKRK